jgi:hypothetical protein
MPDDTRNAQQGLNLIIDSILNVLTKNPLGLSNVEIARILGLETGKNGNQKNYLTWSILQELLARNQVALTPNPKHKTASLYVLAVAVPRTTHTPCE